jgi:hypothetical protein
LREIRQIVQGQSLLPSEAEEREGEWVKTQFFFFGF